MDEVITRAKCYIKGEESNIEKISRYAKEKVRTKEEGIRHMKEYFKSGPRDRQITRPSRRSFEKELDYTPLDARRKNILKEVYHLKLLPRSVSPKEVHTIMGKD